MSAVHAQAVMLPPVYMPACALFRFLMKAAILSNGLAGPNDYVTPVGTHSLCCALG